MRRKIVNISVSAKPESGYFLAVAVAEDGTAWKIRLDVTDNDVNTDWVQLPNLPETDLMEGLE